MIDPLDNFPGATTALGAFMDEFEQSATENPQLILRELDDQRDDWLRESIMELARDAIDYPPIWAWYRAVLQTAAVRYAQRKMKDIEDEQACIDEERRSHNNDE